MQIDRLSSFSKIRGIDQKVWIVVAVGNTPDKASFRPHFIAIICAVDSEDRIIAIPVSALTEIIEPLQGDELKMAVGFCTKYCIYDEGAKLSPIRLAYHVPLNLPLGRRLHVAPAKLCHEQAAENEESLKRRAEAAATAAAAATAERNKALKKRQEEDAKAEAARKRTKAWREKQRPSERRPVPEMSIILPASSASGASGTRDKDSGNSSLLDAFPPANARFPNSQPVLLLMPPAPIQEATASQQVTSYQKATAKETHTPDDADAAGQLQKAVGAMMVSFEAKQRALFDEATRGMQQGLSIIQAQAVQTQQQQMNQMQQQQQHGLLGLLHQAALPSNTWNMAHQHAHSQPMLGP